MASSVLWLRSYEVKTTIFVPLTSVVVAVVVTTVFGTDVTVVGVVAAAGVESLLLLLPQPASKTILMSDNVNKKFF